MDTDNDTSIDATSIAAEIAGELVETRLPGTDSPEGSEGVPHAEASGVPPQEPPALTPIPLPKSWKKEKEPIWATLQREAQEYFTERESDFHKGINTYKQGHESWSNLLSPFQQVLSQHPNVDPVPVMQNLMRSHLHLLSAPQEQKLGLAKQLLEFYGIQLPTGEGQPPAQPVIPREVTTRIETLEQQLHQQRLSEAQKTVEAFFSDKENKYAKDCEDDILRILSETPGLTLAQAYERAMWLNPDVRAKAIADQQAEAAKQAAKEAAAARKAGSLNLGGNQTPRSAPGRKQTIDETIDSVVDKHFRAAH